ncbi:hypothetical protein TNCT_40531 [Trichonephila clavata]|uniref:Uncharacterized protein n=1 Tax=Trichonephila clavata TaxID=2740835 RepID=A0A8X6H731_TRICU|nr:hypothetical protein TNCT_40531 [Trichonephila clavata]
MREAAVAKAEAEKQAPAPVALIPRPVALQSIPVTAPQSKPTPHHSSKKAAQSINRRQQHDHDTCPSNNKPRRNNATNARPQGYRTVSSPPPNHSNCEI